MPGIGGVSGKMKEKIRSFFQISLDKKFSNPLCQLRRFSFSTGEAVEKPVENLENPTIAARKSDLHVENSVETVDKIGQVAIQAFLCRLSVIFGMVFPGENLHQENQKLSFPVFRLTDGAFRDKMSKQSLV